MTADLETLTDFIAEGLERLQEVNDELLTIESTDLITDDQVKLLCRTLHNLKGASRMAKLRSFEALVHAMEDMVKLIGLGKFPVPLMTQMLFEAADALKSACDEMAKEKVAIDSPEIDVVLMKIELFLPEEGEESEGSSTEETDDFNFRYDPADAEELLEDFILEADDMLEALQAACVNLEEEPTREEVDRVFRVAHTLKGSSGAIGLMAMNKLTHRLEEKLDLVRKGEADVTGSLIDLLLSGLDDCEEIVGKLRKEEPFDHDIGPMIAKIKAFEMGTDEASPATAVPTPAQETSTNETISVDAAVNEKKAGAEKTSQSIRVEIGKLDRVINLVGELTITKIRFDQQNTTLNNIRDRLALLSAHAGKIGNAGDTKTAEDFQTNLENLDADAIEFITDQRRVCDDLQMISGNLQDAVMHTRMVPVSQVLTRFNRLVRDMSKAVKKPLRLEIFGENTEIDKTVAEAIGDPLMHIIRNSADHGIEPPDVRIDCGKPEVGTIKVEAMYQGDMVVIEISDDGGGIRRDRVLAKAIENGLITAEEAEQMDDNTVHNLVFRPGFSTAEKVTDISGRGVGMDVVVDSVSKLKGTVHVKSVEGEGSVFTIQLPLTLAVIQTLIVSAAGRRFALPLAAVQETVLVMEEETHSIGTKESFNLRGETVSLIRLSEILGYPDNGTELSMERKVVVATAGDEKIGLEVERFHGKQEVVIKSLGTVLKNVKFASGATIMGDGSLVLIVDLPMIVLDAKDWQGTGPAVRRQPRSLETSLNAETAEKPDIVPEPIPEHSSDTTEEVNVDDDPGIPDTSTSSEPVTENADTILVVDDSRTVLKSLVRDLKSIDSGFDILSANDGAKAFDILSSEKVDAVVTDVFMPNLDGYELCTKIRETPELEEIPVIMISAKGEKLDKMRGFEAGADDYFTKPAEARMLVDRIKKYLRKN